MYLMADSESVNLISALIKIIQYFNPTCLYFMQSNTVNYGVILPP